MKMNEKIKLSKPAVSLWGKKDTVDGQNYWLPLVEHLIDTKNVINYLYNNFLDEGQRLIFRQSLSDNEIEKLIKFVGYFHDIGKATPAFQTKKSYVHNEELDQCLLEKLIKTGFNDLSLGDLPQAKQSPHAKAGEAILEKAGLNISIGAIIGGHHGKPEENIPSNQIRDFTSNYYQKDQDKVIQSKWKAVQDNLIEYGLESIGYNSIQDVPEVSQPVAVILEGLLIMADWLASSQYMNDDKRSPLFPLIPIEQEFKDIDSKIRFQNAINTWTLTDEWDPKVITNIDNQYSRRWNFTPRTVQKTISEAIGTISDPGMIIIEAPMGIGKTEIALTAVEQLAAITQRTGLYMGLPTQATTNAMFTRVEEWLQNISQSEDLTLPIKLMHGKAQFDKEYTDLPKAENIEGQNAVVINSWFSGKKSILTKFTIGTIDHLLLMGLKQKHLFLRHLGLSGKIVVIDEVHAYDVYMSSYLSKVLEWLGTYHVPVIALSATLPKEKRKELLESYAKGKYGKNTLKSTNNWENNTAYPILSYLDGNKLIQVDKFKSKNNEKNQVNVIRFNGDNQTIIDKVIDEIAGGGIAGVIVNTVKRAQELAKLIPKDVPYLVLHSAFLTPDRMKLETKLQKYIGKNGRRPKKMIVIGTQVLEQSLDIDFDVMFTDIAPMDLLIQRVGRLHRHEAARPKSLKNPKVYVTGINKFGDYGDANESIYEKYLLMKTDYFLPNELILPNDISNLVQKVYDKNIDEEIQGVQQAKVKFDNDQKKLLAKAKGFQINEPELKKSRFIREKGTIIGWLSKMQIDADKNDAQAQAAVRDIKETLEVVLIQKTQEGDFLIDGRNINKVTDKEIAEQIIRLPNAVTYDISKTIIYLEELTSKNYPEFQQSIWLKGVLVLPLDEKLQASLNGYQLTYSKALGLSYEKEEQ